MSPTRNINFLLVDDLDANLTALEALLVRDGLTLLKARSGSEALELLLVHEIALAFVDVQMPGMNGFELAELMRSTERTKRVPIIFLTAGIVDHQRRIQGYETGAVDFLLKPIDSAVLLNKASTFYDLAKQRQALEESRARLTELNAELAATNERLERADRCKDEFLAMLAHELRNPIAPILTGVDILLQTPGDTVVVERIGKMMKRQTGQMARLIDDLLDVSRITMGKIELQQQEVAVAEIIDSAVESVMPMMESMKHRFAAGEVPSHWKIHGDPHRLAQVVANLLSNAAKYTPSGGRIRLTVAQAESGGLSVVVSDNGKGIRPELQKRIFDLFDQGSAGPKDGLGIGLTLVKSLVGMHGGTVSVRSDGDNLGSEFSIALPNLRIELNEHSEPEPDGDSDSMTERAGKLRVLIADDGKPTADVLSLFFKLEGMETAVAYDGEEAVDLARQFEPHLVCLDLGMPRLDGFEAARSIREIQPNACIVALSGWGSDEDRRKTAEAGFDEHLTKPVKPSDIRGLVKRRFKTGQQTLV
jgi:signal transduction histidine kinase